MINQHKLNVPQSGNGIKTPHTLKVDNPSHCTTPSDRPDPNLATVKVGCLHIDPSTKKGRRMFLFQMLVLCFVPHAALIIQNCTIMAQLSQTLDSALYLNTEAETILAMGELISSLQDERQHVIEFLLGVLQDNTTLCGEVGKFCSALTTKLDNCLSTWKESSAGTTSYLDGYLLPPAQLLGLV